MSKKNKSLLNRLSDRIRRTVDNAMSSVEGDLSFVTRSGSASVTINGQTFQGNSVSVQGGQVIVDGKPVAADGVAGNGTTSGSGVARTDRRILSPFTKIKNSILGEVSVLVEPSVKREEVPYSAPDVHETDNDPYRGAMEEPEYEVAPTHFVEVTADDNVLDKIRTEVEGDTLRIYMASGIYSTTAPVTVSVQTLKVTGLDHSGHGDFAAKNVTGDHLELKHSGMGDFTVEGTAKDINANFTGHGNVVVHGLEDTTVLDLRHSGMGNVTFTGQARTVHARLSGHGDVNLGPLTVELTNLSASGMGDVILDSKAVGGRHTGHGDLVLKRSRLATDWNVKSTGMGDVLFAQPLPPEWNLG
jgi:hypothetical protein